jgi:hypothetical protein
MTFIRKAFALALSVATVVAPAFSDEGENRFHGEGNDGIRRVLLISIDGMHALDYENCALPSYCPALKALGTRGVNYTRTSTAKPSDSFPGLMSLVTGASPKLHGAYYDVAYDRVLAPPQNTTNGGLVGGTCNPNVINGTRTEYEEGVDIDGSKVNGGFSGYSKLDGGILSIDPKQLPRDPFNGCQPVYPWNFIRANTIYGVIHAAGGYTAWTDKHAVYAAVSGPGNNASNVDDYYSPDSNSDVIPLPGVTLPDGTSCDTGITVAGAWVDNFVNIRCNDMLKVNSILNEIDGKKHLGAPNDNRVPNLFGMNFQAVSVGQKLIQGGTLYGGYSDATGTPTGPMMDQIKFVDATIGKMVAELSVRNLLDSTLIIITAKHGQSPVDPQRFMPIGKSSSPAHWVKLAGLLPASETGGIGATEDDISLLWLNSANAATLATDTTTAVATLEAHAALAGIGQIFYGTSLGTMFNAPGWPTTPGLCCQLRAGGDPRTPDIIVQPNVGVIYTGSSTKQAEHGGFAHDDTNVMLLVSNPSFHAKTVTSFVETMQVAPTILEALGLDPNKLQGVQKEGTPVLPGLAFSH